MPLLFAFLFPVILLCMTLSLFFVSSYIIGVYLIMLIYLRIDGQTGSGKTHTMFGPEGGTLEDGDMRGLIPRSVEYLFSSTTSRSAMYEVAMVCSFLEIYNDTIRDLGKAYLVAMGIEPSSSKALYEKTSELFENITGKRGNPNFTPAFNKNQTDEVMKRPGLREISDQYNLMNYDIREDAEGNVFVKDLSLIPVSSMDEVMTLIAMGLKVRATHETKMNATSSRSHTVFAITIIQRDKSTGQAFSGSLNLVDLAGSERLKKSESQGIRLREALHINTSLTALGKVIMSLDPSSEMTHIPYRDSKLTRMLQNSLGGNSYTTVVGAIHPDSRYYDECLSTLQFANRCRNVQNTPKVNYVSENEDKDRKIKRLMDEVQQMRLKMTSGGAGSADFGTKGNLGGGMGKHTDIHPSKLAEILQKLGVKAELDADGGLIVDGKKVNTDMLGLDGGDSMTDEVSAVGGAGVSRSNTRGQSASNAKKQMEEMAEQLKNVNDLARDRKDLVDKQTNQIKKLSADLVRYQTGLKHKEHLYDQLNIEKDRLLKEQEERMSTNFEGKMKETMNQNQALLTQQHTTLQKMPVALKEYTDLLKKLKEDYEKDNEPLLNEHKREMASLETSLRDQMESLKQQYEHWLEQKDKALETYVQKFNEYKQKKHDQLHKCELEVVRLHDHVEKVEAILVGFEKGEYPVLQRQGYFGRPTTGVILSIDGDGNLPVLPPGSRGYGGIATAPVKSGIESGGVTKGLATNPGFIGTTKAGGIVIPKGLRPTNPLVPDKNTGEASLAKKIVAKYRSQEAAESNEKNKSMQQAQMLTSMGSLDPEIHKQIQDMIQASTPKKTINKSRSRTLSSEMESIGQKSSRGAAGEGLFDESAMAVYNNRRYGGGASSAPTAGIQNDVAAGTNVFTGNNTVSMGYTNMNRGSNNDDENKDELIFRLNQEVNLLKSEKYENRLENEKIVKALSGNDTMQYIRQLEAEQDRLHKYIREVAKQLKSSKVANASLTRQLERKSYEE